MVNNKSNKIHSIKFTSFQIVCLIYMSLRTMWEWIEQYLFILFLLLKQLNLDRLLAKMWEEMGLVRVYTKPQGQQPDFSDPVVLSTVCFNLFEWLSW